MSYEEKPLLDPIKRAKRDFALIVMEREREEAEKEWCDRQNFRRDLGIHRKRNISKSKKIT